MRDRGLVGATRSIAPAFLLPLLERASIEGADDLQDVWAMMLANATDADCRTEMRSAFVAMLGEMTHLDVVILAKLASAYNDPAFPHGLPTSMLPDEIGHGGDAQLLIGPVGISLYNLARFGCIEAIPAMGGMSYGQVWVTVLGKAFVAACTSHLPKPSPTGVTAAG